MKNVNLAVAQEISEKRPDIKHYNVEYLLSQGEPILRSLNRETDMVETTDLAAIREAKMRDVCDEFIKYLDRKFDNLLDFRYILVTGGTGAFFFNQMLKHYKKTGLMDENICYWLSPHSTVNHCPSNLLSRPVHIKVSVGRSIKARR